LRGTLQGGPRGTGWPRLHGWGPGVLRRPHADALLLPQDGQSVGSIGTAGHRRELSSNHRIWPMSSCDSCDASLGVVCRIGVTAL
jgi:hypothetical protein